MWARDCEQMQAVQEQKRSSRMTGPPVRKAMALATLAWVFGSVWMNATAGTPFAGYAKALGASKFQFGLLGALPFIASLMSIPASLLIEATGKRKRIFLWGLYFQRLMWFPIAILPLLIVKQWGFARSGPAMALFLWLVFLMHTGQAVGGPAWVSWMADIVPDRVRGKYFSRRRQWGILTAVPAALGVGWLLDHYGSSDRPLIMLGWCSVVFMAAAVFGFADIHLFQFVPDVPKAPQSGKGLLKAWREPLRNKQFLWFAGFVGTLTFAVGFMGQFVTLYIMKQMSADGAGRQMNMVTQLMVIVAPAVAQLLVLPVWGIAADRMGKRPLLIVAALGLVPVALGWCFVSRETIWLGYLLSAAGAALWTGVEIANFNLAMEMCADNEGGGTSYVAVNSVIINIAGCLGNLTFGLVAQLLENWQWQTGWKIFTSFDVLFAMSAVLRLAAVVVFLPHIHEPASRPTREAVRFMAANIYNNLFHAILQPLRLLRIRREPMVEFEQA